MSAQLKPVSRMNASLASLMRRSSRQMAVGMMLFSKMLRKRARLMESARPAKRHSSSKAADDRKMMLMTTWNATNDNAFSTGSGPFNGPKPLTMASMEIAPAVSEAAQAPETPKRIVAQPSSGSGAYSSSGVRSGLVVGRKNSSAHTARMVSDSV